MKTVRRILYPLLGMALFGIGATPAFADPLKDSVPHITTKGYASADVVPDEAILLLGIETERPSAAAASSDMAKAASTVIAEIKAASIEDKDVKTTSVALTIVYDEEHDQSGYRVTKRTFRGYKSSESLSIRIRDVKKAGILAQRLMEKGVNDFRGIAFDYSKAQEKRRALQADAIRDALAEAQSYTNAIGLRLGRVIEIDDNHSIEPEDQADLPSRGVVPNAKTVATIAIPMEPGVQTISASINVTWELNNTP